MKKLFCIKVRILDEMGLATYLHRLIPAEEDVNGRFNALDAALQKDGIGWQKVVGYASGGENIMQGQGKSVLTRLKDVVPDLFVLKCFCHSFHLIASYAYKNLSKSVEELVHDVYNYCKNSPNKQKSYGEFQHFVRCQPQKILKPCQTHWLSLLLCVTLMLQQWPALLQYFISEAMETKSSQAQRILQALQSPYTKGTVEFMNCVLGNLTALNAMVQSESFKLHCLIPEVERVVKMFCHRFLKTVAKEIMAIDVDMEANWRPIAEVYPGLLAHNAIGKMKPHEKESFLTRCHDWYREAVRQSLQRVDASHPVVNAMKDIGPRVVIDSKAKQLPAGILSRHLPQLCRESSPQEIDR